MRLFVAVVPPASVLADLDAAVDVLRAGAPAQVRWIPVERQHLTLAFLSEVDDDRVERVVLRLGESLDAAPAAGLQLRGAGRFSRQVLWAGVDGDLDVLQRLARVSARGARAAGVQIERRPYRAHLTLARVRGRADLAPMVEELAGYAGPRWLADEVVLMRSHLGPTPTYDPVAAWPLRGG